MIHIRMDVLYVYNDDKVIFFQTNAFIFSTYFFIFFFIILVSENNLIVN